MVIINENTKRINEGNLQKSIKDYGFNEREINKMNQILGRYGYRISDISNVGGENKPLITLEIETLGNISGIKAPHLHSRSIDRKRGVADYEITVLNQSSSLGNPQLVIKYSEVLRNAADAAIYLNNLTYQYFY